MIIYIYSDWYIRLPRAIQSLLHLMLPLQLPLQKQLLLLKQQLIRCLDWWGGTHSSTLVGIWWSLVLMELDGPRLWLRLGLRLLPVLVFAWCIRTMWRYCRDGWRLRCGPRCNGECWWGCLGCRRWGYRYRTERTEARRRRAKAHRARGRSKGQDSRQGRSSRSHCW